LVFLAVKVTRPEFGMLLSWVRTNKSASSWEPKVCETSKVTVVRLLPRSGDHQRPRATSRNLR